MYRIIRYNSMPTCPLQAASADVPSPSGLDIVELLSHSGLCWFSKLIQLLLSITVCHIKCLLSLLVVIYTRSSVGSICGDCGNLSLYFRLL